VERSKQQRERDETARLVPLRTEPTMSTTTTATNSTPETFDSLCKELGKRIHSMDNALLCHRAYVAYNAEHPNSTQGKSNKSDRDATEVSFRKAAAKASGVSASTIDALLQVGKAIASLSDEVKATLSSCSLGNWTRGLRKLATKKFDDKRAEIITDFAKEEASDPQTARANLEKTLGMVAEGQDGSTASTVQKPAPAANPIEETRHQLGEGGHFDVLFGKEVVRVIVGTNSNGLVLLTVLRGEKEKVDAHLSGLNAQSITPKPNEPESNDESGEHPLQDMA
jgi:hypothetical protein